MNTIEIVLQVYKNELAQANEQKVILQVQVAELKQKVGQLEKEIEQLKQKGEE